MKEIYQQTVKDKIQRQNQEFSMEGLRVLAFTYREIPENIRTLMLPHKPLIEVQRGLLQVAPFKVKQNILDRVKYT